MAILVNDAPAAELSNLCDIVRARRRVATRTKGFVTRKIDRREGTERIGPRPRRERERDRDKSKGKMGKVVGKEKANIRDVVTVGSLCKADITVTTQELATRDPTYAR